MFDINNFIKDQVQLLLDEKYCYLQQVVENKKLSGTLIGTIVKKTKPSCYGGTIVTLQLRSSNENAELPLKQGNPVGLAAVDNNDFYRGIVVLIR